MRKLNLALLTLIVALAAVIVFMLVAPAASAKRPHTAAAPATLTATYDAGTQHLSIAGCGYDISIGGGVQVVYTHPSTATETWYDGIVWADGAQCLDSNYILASEPGTWTIDTFQAGVQVAETTITIP